LEDYMASYTAENTAQRERLIALAARLTDEDLLRPLDHGWTVAAALVHLAFWDRSRWGTLRRWLENGEFPSSLGTSPDPINDAVYVLSQAIPPRAAPKLAMDAAETVDSLVEQLTPDQVAALESAGLGRMVNRSLHRREHLDQIEQALG
jgi:hypothetical protein